MKKLFLIIACAFSISTLSAQNKEEYYVYGVDFSYARVYAAEESVEQFAKAFTAINMLIVQESEKYDFSRVVNRRVKVVMDPILKIASTCSYSGLKTWDSTYTAPDYAAIIKGYNLPQTEGTGIIMMAKVLNKLENHATYELIIFDIASRNIIAQRKVKGNAGGFGLRNYWARSVYEITETTRIKMPAK